MTTTIWDDIKQTKDCFQNSKSGRSARFKYDGLVDQVLWIRVDFILKFFKLLLVYRNILLIFVKGCHFVEVTNSFI